VKLSGAWCEERPARPLAFWGPTGAVAMSKLEVDRLVAKAAREPSRPRSGT
jgi:hypothetical protein